MENVDVLKKEGQLLLDEVNKMKATIELYINKLENISTVEEKAKNAIEKVELMEKRIAELEQKNRDLQEKLERVSKIAYIDTKFEINNVNAFNEKLFGKGVSPKSVAIIDVWNMKMINEEYDESIGDGVIRDTVEALRNMFGSDNVFRIRGAQFGVVLDEDNFAKVKGMLESVQNSLYKNREIEIIFGQATVSRYPSREEAYERALEELRGIRVSKGAAERASYEKESAVIEQSMEDAVEDEEVRIVDEKEVIKEEKQENPNISPSVFAGVREEENNIIVEVDATSIDVAMEIMNMYGNKK